MSASVEFRTLSAQAKSLKLGRYRHFKGNEYVVLGVGKHTETLEEFVVYQPDPVTDDLLCVRPLAMFLDTVDRPNYTGPRFRYLSDYRAWYANERPSIHVPFS